MKIAPLLLVATIAFAPLAKAESMEYHFRDGVVFKLDKGGLLCRSQAEFRYDPVDQAYLLDRKALRNVAGLSGGLIPRDNQSPFGGGDTIRAKEEVRSSPCEQTNRDCNGRVREDEIATVGWTKDFRRMYVKRERVTVETNGPFFTPTVINRAVIAECYYSFARSLGR